MHLLNTHYETKKHIHKNNPRGLHAVFGDLRQTGKRNKKTLHHTRRQNTKHETIKNQNRNERKWTDIRDSEKLLWAVRGKPRSRAPVTVPGKSVSREETAKTKSWVKIGLAGVEIHVLPRAIWIFIICRFYVSTYLCKHTQLTTQPAQVQWILSPTCGCFGSSRPHDFMKSTQPVGRDPLPAGVKGIARASCSRSRVKKKMRKKCGEGTEESLRRSSKTPGLWCML